MRVFIDRSFAQEKIKRGAPAPSPFALHYLPGLVDKKTSFLRENMFKTLEGLRFYKLSDTPEAADIVFMPFNLGKVRMDDPDIEKHYRSMAERAGRPLLIDYLGDDTNPVKGDRVIVLRTSSYRSELSWFDIVCPPVVEDIGVDYGFQPIGKPIRPSLGFVGLARKRNAATLASKMFRYGRQDYLNSALALWSPTCGKRRSGIYFRDRVLRTFENSKDIDTDFTTRSYWGRGKRARNRVGHEQMRAEFIENIRRNLYLLSVRGRGNFSLRFFEILSAGRIPVHLDTDTPLPLENKIDYHNFTVFENWRRLAEFPERLARFHAETDESSIFEMQERARSVFESYLRFDSFVGHLFDQCLPDLVASKTRIIQPPSN
jgi:hypothetical protein